MKASVFVEHIRESTQYLRLCGMKVVKRAVQTMSDIFRAMILHASVQWKDGIDTTFWYMNNPYDAYIYDHMPTEYGNVPADLLSRT